MEAESEFARLEQALVRAGSLIAYPPTPALALHVREGLAVDLALHRMRGLPRWSRLPRGAFAIAAALLVAIALLLAFPDARDALAQLLGLRTVRIILVTPTPTPPATATGTVTPLPTVTGTTTTKPSSQCCETTLDQARALSRFKILLPPSELPSKVSVQQLPDFGNAQQVILVFGDPSAPRFTLYEATNFLYGKLVSGGTVIEETTVKGERALWLSGAPHLLVYLDANGKPEMDTQRPVDANTLAWESGDATFRLETKQSEQEAVRFAESLR
jgi:hypothetical protein